MHAFHLDINSMWRKLFPLDILLRNVGDVLWNGPVRPVPPRNAGAPAAGPVGVKKPSTRELTAIHSFILSRGNRFYTGPHIPEQNGLVFPTLHSHLKRVLHRWFTLQTETDFKKIGTRWRQPGSARKKVSE